LSQFMRHRLLRARYSRVLTQSGELLGGATDFLTDSIPPAFAALSRPTDQTC
jgi:hypothetical protein